MNTNLVALFEAAGGALNAQSQIVFPTPIPEASHLQKNYIVPLPQYDGLFFSGVDAQKFLQGQVTCNVDKITIDRYFLGAQCNPKGYALSLFYIIPLLDSEQNMSYFLRLPTSMCSYAKQMFTKYALFSKLSISQDENWVSFGLAGSNVDQIISRLFNLDPEFHKNKSTIQITNDSERILIIKEQGPRIRFQVFLPISLYIRLWPHLLESTTPLSSTAWELWDIESEIPAIYPQTVEKVLAPYLNLESLNAISFDKGCYVGQEVIARMHYRGKTKKHMYLTECKTLSIPMSGDELIDQENIIRGLVIRSVKIDEQNCKMLVILDDEFASFENIFLSKDAKAQVYRLSLNYNVKH